MDHTFRITCDCETCKINAERLGADFPLAALIRPQAADGLGITLRTANKASKVHRMVWSAYDPSQGSLPTARRFAVPAYEGA
jgi:hypothetical protein